MLIHKAAGTRRLGVGRKDRRFWRVAAVLLDLLENSAGRLGEAAAVLGITTGNFTSVLKSDRHLLASAQQIRKHHGHGSMREIGPLPPAGIGAASLSGDY